MDHGFLEPGCGPPTAGKHKGARKGRRWSLDIISPFFQPRKRSTALLDPPDGVCTERRLSSSTLSPSSSGGSPVLALSFPWRRTPRTSEHDAFIVVHPRDGDSYVVTVEDEGELRTLVEAARMEKKEERVSSYRVIVAATRQSRASLDSSLSHYRSCENLLQHLQAVAEHSALTDDRLTIVTELLQSEQQYYDNLEILYEQYAEPLRKFSSLSKEDHRILFVGLEPIFKLSASFIKKLDSAIGAWDTTLTRIGNLFSNKFWSKFDEYYDTYDEAKQFLTDRLRSDTEFENFCDLRQQNGVPSLHALLFLPIKRIPEYDKYLNELLDETDSSHPDFEDLTKAANRVKNMVKDREEEVREAENDQRMETIQDRFPYDDLQLRDKDKVQPKSRGLSLRRRSAPSAVVFRTLTASKSRSSSAIWSQNNMGRKEHDSFSAIKQAADASRLYVMEGPTQFAMGMQTQDRYLFLFSDLLLVAKQKNSTTFKLKFRVPLCDVWLSTCVDEVTELTRPLDRSFVIGWPTCNVAATFKDAATKDKWMTKLSEHVQEEKQRMAQELSELALKVVLRDEDKSQNCEVNVGITQQARDVLQDCLTQLHIPDSDSKDYKLWVWYGKEGSPYPLIGHETPFSIKVSHLREIARSRGAEENMTLAELSSVLGDEPPSAFKCEFILKQKKSPKHHSQDEASHKSMKKAKKASPLLHIFKRGGRDGVSDRRRDDKTNNNTATPPGKLFGLPLPNVCDSDNNPPKPVVDLLTVLFREGPHTTGILRKSANARLCRELRERIDQGEAMDEGQAFVVGSVLKEYLRSLPDSLLMEDLYDDWVKVSRLEDGEEKMAHVRHLLSRMPACNLALLKRILCVLHHIQRLSDSNKMTSYNLSLCISPSLLWHKDHIDLSSGAPAVEFMIDRCVELFGSDVLRLLGDPGQFKSRQDSGTDSDSMHSVLSMHDTGNGLRRDDSSIDSLVERELYTGEGEGGESSPKLAKSHLSPSNLSRDSGLTLSDTQLYDDDSADHSDPRSGKNYLRSTSHYMDREDYELDSYHLDAPANPVPPPRKRGKRNAGDADHASRMDSGGGLRGRDKRHILHSSMSSSRLLDGAAGGAKTDTYRPLLTHPSFSTRVSADLEQQGMDREELQGYRKSMDIGMLHKSASGAHLILDDETLPRKFSESNGGVPRQSSGVDSTPPQSPQSKYSFSSRDSVLSDSSYGAGSRDNSVNSAPQTPDDDHTDRLPPWLPLGDLEPSDPQRLTMNVNLPIQDQLMVGSQAALCASYCSSQLHSVQNVRYLVSPPASPVYELENQGFPPMSAAASRQDHAFQPPPPSPWPGKSHEAEDVTRRASPQIQITQCSSSSDEKLDEPEEGEEDARRSRSASSRAFPLEIAQAHSHVSLPVKQMSKYSQSLAKGSPPPRVLLQSLRSPRSGKDPAPIRASHDSDIVAQVQRGGLASAGGSERETAEMGGSAALHSSSHGFDAARSMEAINDAEYIAVKPKLTIIRREESIHSNVSSYSSGSGGSVGRDSHSSVTLSSSPSARSTSSSSSGGSGSTLAADSARPIQPPAYTAALQRKFMLDHDVPVDVAPMMETQRKANEKAKILYEESLQKYLQDRYEQKHPIHAAARKISDPGAPTNSSSIVVGHARSESDQPHGVASSGDAAISNEDLYVTLRNQRRARKLYLESLQRYEQQQTVPVQPGEQDTCLDSSASRSVESVAVSGPRQRVVDTVSESATQHRTSRCVTESKSQQRSSELSETRTSVKRDSRPKSMLEIPSSGLHRSLSDSADRLNKLGQWSSRSRPELRDSANSEHRQSVNSGVNSERVDVCQAARRKTSEAAAYEGRECSEGSPAHHYFPTASCFYHPEDSPRSGKTSPASRSPRAQSPRHHLDAHRYARADSAAVQSPRVDSSAVKSPRMDHPVVVSSRADNSAARLARSESPVLGSPRTSPPSAVRGCVGDSSSADLGRVNIGATSESGAGAAAVPPNPAGGGGGRARSELGWSVKNLRKIYCSDTGPGPEQQLTESARAGLPAASTSGARPAPPPYQDPPPFRRLQDRSRLSTSSNSSNGSNSTGRSCSPSSRGSASSARRLGPQGVSVDYSSSEELSYHNSRWSRARSESGSGSGLSDQEMTNAFTDISYV